MTWQAHQPPQANHCHVWPNRKCLVAQRSFSGRKQPKGDCQDKNKPVAPSNQRRGLKKRVNPEQKIP